MKDSASGVVSDMVFAGGLRIGKVQGGVNYYYHMDRLGSVRLVTQSANVQAFSTKYLPCGSSYATLGSETFQFTGKQFDVSAGLNYFGYRFYDSQLSLRELLTCRPEKSILGLHSGIDRREIVYD